MKIFQLALLLDTKYNMGNSINLAFLFMSFFGIFIMLAIKVPVLSEINPSQYKKKPSLFFKGRTILEKIFSRIRSFSFYNFIHKLLSKIKILNLKIEKIIDYLLGKIRKKKSEKKD